MIVCLVILWAGFGAPLAPMSVCRPCWSAQCREDVSTCLGRIENLTPQNVTDWHPRYARCEVREGSRKIATIIPHKDEEP